MRRAGRSKWYSPAAHIFCTTPTWITARFRVMPPHRVNLSVRFLFTTPAIYASNALYATPKQWKLIACGYHSHLSHYLVWGADKGRQANLSKVFRLFSIGRCYATTAISSNRALQVAGPILRIEAYDASFWDRRHVPLSCRNNKNDIWAAFELIIDQELIDVFSGPDSKTFRDEVLDIALRYGNSRLAKLLVLAQSLSVEKAFCWPDLYYKTVYFFLSQDRYHEAVLWHLQLVPIFPPSTKDLGSLLSSFVVDATPMMQVSLRTLYALSKNRKLYDYIIPALFSSGQSKLARSWRKRFLLFNDFPTSSKARPFLHFLHSYYPSISLAQEELLVANPDVSISNFEKLQDAISRDYDSCPGQYSDLIMAKWFASEWASVEFAISIVHRLGYRAIGPRSLQSLALRESNSKDIANMLTHLEKLGFTVLSQAYCKALVVFAKHGKDDLLAGLLRCDVHPDEFNDPETRHMLLLTAIRKKDWKLKSLLQGIEWAIGSDSLFHRFHPSIRSEAYPPKQDIAQTVTLLDRIEASGTRMTQSTAMELLRFAFLHLEKRAMKRKHLKGFTDDDLTSPLNQAIGIIRRISCHDVAIPLRYWKLLLYHLGQLGRFEELTQICFEILELYSPPEGGLVAVYEKDVPRPVRTEQTSFMETHMLRKADSEIIAGVNSFAGAKGKVLEEDNTQQSHDAFPVSSLVSGLGELNRQRATKIQRGASRRALELWQTIGSPQTRATVQSCRPISQDSCIEDSNKKYDPLLIRHEASPAYSKKYLPSDVPFTHREHPIQKIFNANMQRSMVRWGFDQTMAARPKASAVMGIDSSGITRYDVACGVRLLALLRARGVLVDTQVLRSEILSRIAQIQSPGRRRDRSRDRNETSVEHVKRMMDDAWGSEILPSVPKLIRELERPATGSWR